MSYRIIYFAGLLYCHNLFSQLDSSRVDKKTDTTLVEFNLPVFSGPETEDGMEEQEVNSLLTSSKDVYLQFATYQFAVARFRIRGSSSKNQQVFINGINLADPENGLALWSSWSGLNDVTRYSESRVGNTASPYGFSGSLGYIYIDAKASSFKKGTRISYANSNRQFQNRWMLTHFSGNLKNGWTFALSVSNTSGNLYTQGTSISAYAFYFSADKRVNDKHLISFTGFVTPAEKAGSGTEQQEAFDLAGSNYYNALWGFQNGKARNASIRTTNKPVLIVSHNYKPDQNTQWNSSLAYTFGKSSISGFNWNQSPNPRPDYYRYLPSYNYSLGDSLKGNAVADKWRDDVNTRQINWDQLIALNRANLYSIPSTGVQTPNTTETRARYILENRTEYLNSILANTTFHKRMGRMLVSGGINGLFYQNRKYKTVGDLLGATYWLDYDQFAQNLGVDPFVQQNNLDAPDKKIYKGDKFGYDYTINIRKAEVWSQLEYGLRRFEFYAAASLSESTTWRESFMANGKFPTTSKGKSKQLNFLNYGFKAGGTYKFSGKHYLAIGTTYLTRAPDMITTFISPDVRNDLLEPVKNEKLFSGEISYILRTQRSKLRITGYLTQLKDQTWVKTFWSDVSNTFINYCMTGVDQQQLGMEVGIEKTLFVSHTLQCAIGLGNFIYTSRPTAQAWQNNNRAAIFNNRTVYLKNYHSGGTPQTSIGFGYRYNSVKRWFAGFNVNYFGRLYAELNPDRRTSEAVGKYRADESEQLQKIIAQEQLPGYYVVNVSIGKSFRLVKKYILNLNFSVNNLLNNKTNRIADVEQLRWDPQYPDRFANKYVYMPGITYMALVNFNF